MKKSELIQKLKEIPGDPEVCIFDYRKNLAHDDGDGASAGIYPDIHVELISNEDDPEFVPWIGMEFKNEELEDDFAEERACRVCGCTESNCRQCIEKTGFACHWVAEDLCSRCADEDVSSL